MRDKRTITFYIFVYVFSESLFQISKSSTFFKLNQNAGVISSVMVSGNGGDNLAATTSGGLPVVEPPLQDEIFKIICNGPVWEQKPVNMSNL